MLREVAGEGEAYNRSLSETMPTSSPFLLRTGRRRTFCSRMNCRAWLMGTSPVIVVGCLDILSCTSVFVLLGYLLLVIGLPVS